MGMGRGYGSVVRMKSSLGNPTKAQSRRMEIIKTNVGCIVSYLEYGGYTPCEIHHLMDTGSRRGHEYTIGLTPEHHQGNNGIHKAKKAFREDYGTDDFLLAETNFRVAEFEARTVGVA